MARERLGNWRVGLTAVIVGAVLVIVAPVFAPPAEQNARKRSVRASELGGDVAVIGALRQPLGKLVTIEGRSADGEVLREKAKLGTTILFVETVDGKAVPDGTWVEILPYGPRETYEGGPEDEQGVVTLGYRCKLLGYETGGFSGSPSGAMKASGEFFADHGWYFTTDFRYVKVLKNEKDDVKKPYPVPRD